MVQIYTWAYQDWKTISEDDLRKLVGLPQGITADEFKTITGHDYQTAATETVNTDTTNATTTSTQTTATA